MTTNGCYNNDGTKSKTNSKCACSRISTYDTDTGQLPVFGAGLWYLYACLAIFVLISVVFKHIFVYGFGRIFDADLADGILRAAAYLLIAFMETKYDGFDCRRDDQLYVASGDVFLI